MLKRIRLIVFSLVTLCLVLPIWSDDFAIKPVTNTEGYEFFVTWPMNFSGMADNTYINIYVSSRAENKIVVEGAGNNVIAKKTVRAGGVETISIPSKEFLVDEEKEKNQGKTPAVGVRVYSENRTPMTVYTSSFVGTDKAAKYDGAHVLPVEALGYEYIVQNTPTDEIATEFIVMATERILDDKGKEKGIDITFTPTGPIRADNGYKETINLKYKQVFLVRGQTVSDESASEADFAKNSLTGTQICANGRIAVWTANQSARIPANRKGLTSNFSFDQLLPVAKWGTEFIVPMTAMHSVENEVRVMSMSAGTNVTVTSSNNTKRTKALEQFEDWGIQIKNSNGVLADSTLYIKSTKPVQVCLYTSSAQANIYKKEDDGDQSFWGDPSMTMIAPIAYATDTIPFTTIVPGKDPLKHYINVWVTKEGENSLQLDGVLVKNKATFKDVTGASGYKIAKVEVDDETSQGGYHVLTADRKSFGGFIYGMGEAEAYLYPLGYEFRPPLDSLFLSGKYDPIEVHTSEKKAGYPDRDGGWHLNQQMVPGYPEQDTVFVCDSTKLRFVTKLNNKWDKVKWEIKRIDFSTKKRKDYKEDESVRTTNAETAVTAPFLETEFYMLPEKEQKDSKKRHPYEDFIVNAIMYRQPTFCTLAEDEWPRDTLNAIVRVFRSYNDTTWMISCDDVSKDYKRLNSFFKDPETGESTTFYFPNDPNKPSSESKYVKLLQYGGDGADGRTGKQNTYRESYTTAHGCDSTVTLKVLLCASDVQPKKTDYICEAGLQEYVNSLGGFFSNKDLDIQLANYKKQLRDKDNDETFGDKDNKWTYYGKGPNGQTWVYIGTDVIPKQDCKTDMDDWNRRFGAAYPRSHNLGCDMSLTLELHILPTTDIEYDTVCCTNQFKWHIEENLDYQHKFTDTIIDRTQANVNKRVDYIHYYYRQRQDAFNGCASEKHILHLTFTNGEVPMDEELCDDGDPYVVDKVKFPDISDPNFDTWSFDPKGKSGSYPKQLIVDCANNDCEYKRVFNFTVHEVESYRDTFVYCYDNGAQIDGHLWEDHRQGWVMEKGKPNTKRRYDDANTSTAKKLTFKRDKNNKIIYELTDTVRTTPCHTVYQQTVILMPQYKDMPAPHDPISTEDWFEWEGYIWYGEDVIKDTIPNPSGKTPVKLSEFATAPAGMTLQYLEGQSLYAITTTTQTNPYKSISSEDGWSAVCDSTVQLTVQVAPVQRETTYWYTCTCDTPYVWFAGGVTRDTIDISAYMDIKDSTTIHVKKTDLKTTISKRIDPNDINKGKPSYSVAGIKAEFDHYVTLFPSYREQYDTIVCQDPAGTLEFKEMTFELDKYGKSEKSNDNKKTVPKLWINRTENPKPGLEEVEVKCDSGEVAVVTVSPIYRDDINKDLATKKELFYTHEAYKYFTDPEVLFVGMDYFTTHPQVQGEDALKEQMGVDSIVWVDERLLPDLGDASKDLSRSYAEYEWSQEMKDGSKAKGKDGEELGCDSTSFLHFFISKAIIKDPVYIGDNGHILGDDDDEKWSFGGDTVRDPVSGMQTSSFPYITGDYFKFYYDEDGNVVGEVPFDEEDEGTRRNSGAGNDKQFDVTVNSDGTRTYLLKDSVWDPIMERYKYIIQSVTVFPTYFINYFKSREWKNAGNAPVDSVIPACIEDKIEYPWDRSRKVEVSSLKRIDGRRAILADTFCVESFREEYDFLCLDYPEVCQSQNCFCVDSIIYTYVDIYGNTPTTKRRPQCFNDPEYAWKDLTGFPVNYNVRFDPEEPPYTVNQLINGLPKSFIQTLLDTIIRPQNNDNLTCVDYLTLEVEWMPSYGIEEYGGLDTRYDTYLLDPFVTDTTFCQYDNDVKWILEDGTEHKPTNLYDSDGNKVPGNKIPTDMPVTDSNGNIITYIFRDSLKTVGCGCDSIYTLKFKLEEAPKPVYDTIKACIGDTIYYPSINNPCKEIIITSEPREEDFTFSCPNPAGGCDSTYNLHVIKEECTNYYIIYDDAVYNDAENKDVVPVCYEDTANLNRNTANVVTIHFECEGEFMPIKCYVYTEDSVTNADLGITLLKNLQEKDSISLDLDPVAWKKNQYIDTTIVIKLKGVRDINSLPQPGIYPISVRFHDNIHEPKTKKVNLEVRHPSWILTQITGDMILVKDAAHNGGYEFISFQWYKNGIAMFGETKPYLYVPGGLDKSLPYSLQVSWLDSLGTVVTSRTCWHEIVNTDSIKINLPDLLDYLVVVPICVPLSNPYIHIMAKEGIFEGNEDNNNDNIDITNNENKNIDISGKYSISTIEGQFVSSGYFKGKDTSIALPRVAGMYIVRLEAKKQDGIILQMPIRTIKVVVGEVCQE